jgi:hypothetical protein
MIIIVNENKISKDTFFRVINVLSLHTILIETEVKNMEKTYNQNGNDPNNDIDQDAIMNRVNQTFDKISQDVKNMINNNNQLNNDQLS